MIFLGQSGLQELVKLSVLFEEFNTTLFAESSLNLERAVQDATVNKKLDKAIEKFLVLSSPYFLLSATHKALEWLIHRYYIHQYNRDKFILLILPYHETRMFVRYVISITKSLDFLKLISKKMCTISFLCIIALLERCS